jgi:hypothetical protein
MEIIMDFNKDREDDTEQVQCYFSGKWVNLEDSIALILNDNGKYEIFHISKEYVYDNLK